MDRSQYIGSSDAQYILSGDWDLLYRQKIGMAEEIDLSGNFAVQLGRLTEPFHLEWTVAALRAERHDDDLEWSKGPNPDSDASQHFALLKTGAGTPIGSHPDALLMHVPNRTVHCIEVKHTGRFQSAEACAHFYMPQLQHHMLAWGHDALLFSVVIGNIEPERIWIGRSESWLEHYSGRCDAFWTHVTNRAPPPQRLFDSDMKPLVPTKIADSVPLNGFKRRSIQNNNRAQSLVPEFLETRRAEKRHEEIKDELKRMMAADENELYSDAITLKKDKRGAIRFTVKDEAA